MTVAEQLTQIAENESRVYDAGRRAAYDAFWDSYQEKGARTGYNYAFVNFDADTFYPKYDMRPTRCIYMFGDSNLLSTFMGFDLVARLKECGVVLDTSQSTDVNSMFLGVNIATVPTLDLRSSEYSLNLFRNSTTIRSVEKVILRDDGSTDIGGSFNYNFALEEIRFEGAIATDLDLRWSEKLSWNSFQSIYDAAMSGGYLGKVFTLTFSRALIDRLFESAEGAGDGSQTGTWATYYGMASFNIALI